MPYNRTCCISPGTSQVYRITGTGALPSRSLKEDALLYAVYCMLMNSICHTDSGLDTVHINSSATHLSTFGWSAGPFKLATRAMPLHASNVIL
jgi:hypothetical protein